MISGFDPEMYSVPGFMARLAFRAPLKLATILVMMTGTAYILSCAFLFKGGFEAAVDRGVGRLGADLMVAPQEADLPLEKGLIGGVPVSFSLPAGVEDQVAALPEGQIRHGRRRSRVLEIQRGRGRQARVCRSPSSRRLYT